MTTTFETGVKQYQFVETTPEGVNIYIQVLDLGEQLYVWLASGSNDLKSLCLAVPTRLVRSVFSDGRRPLQCATAVCRMPCPPSPLSYQTVPGTRPAA
jgi:hypothetical protein